MNQALRNRLLTDPPASHRCDGAPQTGGFDASMLKLFERVIDEAGERLSGCLGGPP